MGGFIRCVGIIVDLSLLTAIIGLSMAVTISVALLKEDFNGQCPIFSDIYPVGMAPGGKANCNFLIGMHCVAMFVALVAGIYRIIEACKRKRLLTTKAAPVAFVVTYFLVAVSVLASASVITIGFNRLCDGLAKERSWLLFNECRDYQNDVVGWGIYDGSKFYNYLITAEASAWLSFLSWSAIALFALFMSLCCKGKDT